MALRIQRIELKSFRNWDSLVIEPSAGLTVIVGPNAVGKTNIVEAVQLLTAGRSFRSPKWADVVTEGTESGSASMRAEGDGRVRDVRMVFSAEGKREIWVNESKKRGAGEIVGVLPSVLFTPDDLRLVKDSAQRRRDEIDELGEQLSPGYRDIRSQFDRALRQRNALLKHDATDDALFEAWTERFVELGAALALHRVRLFGRLKGAMESAYERVSGGEKMVAGYESAFWEPDPSADRGELAERLLSQLADRVEDERARRVTLVGPHRDDISFVIDGRDARTQASQGQQRTIALSWKMSEVNAVEEITGSRPVLLLDDVMSELDAKRRDELSDSVLGAAQTIVTTTNLGYFGPEALSSAKVITLGEE